MMTKNIASQNNLALKFNPKINWLVIEAHLGENLEYWKVRWVAARIQMEVYLIYKHSNATNMTSQNMNDSYVNHLPLWKLNCDFIVKGVGNTQIVTFLKFYAAVSSFLRFLNAFFEQIKISSNKLMFLKACANVDAERLGSARKINHSTQLSLFETFSLR